MIATQKNIASFNNEKFNVEVFDSGYEVNEISRGRSMTSSSFHDKRTCSLNKDWDGVETWAEAEELMANGYQPIVDKLKGLKITAKGDGKRVKFTNEVVGYQPVVPLYLIGVPNCMASNKVKRIKTRVLNVYYNNSVSAMYSPEEIENAGKKLLSAILELELQGYKFNLWATQSYYEPGKGSDTIVVKMKNSSTPLDLKRMSFQLAHPAFFRVISFDWYSRTPRGRYRDDYGYPLTTYFSDEQINKGFEELFNMPCIVISAQRIINADVPYLKEMLTKGQEKRNG